MKRRKMAKRLLTALLSFFIFMNVVAMFHAYKFTHFADSNVVKTRDAKDLSTSGKIRTILFGIDNPRPVNKTKPAQKFETIILQSNKAIECWSVKADNARGTVIIFHGFSGNKSTMLDKSDEFLKLGYNTFLVDFMGSGGSEGNQTTIGFQEAEEVKTCYDYLAESGEKKIFLFGTSMGAVAILKALNDHNLDPAAIIIECPFGSMYQTTCARFKSLNIPTFPMAALLVFWGGIENGFWAYSFRPAEYAKAIRCPALLLYGGKDEKVSRQEIDEIFENMNCKKQLRTYPLAGHENYLKKYREQWKEDILSFLRSL